MKIKVFVFVVILAILMSGCVLPKRPSVCDNAPSDSVLCSIANKNPDSPLRLEDVGNALIMVNAVLIGDGIYTKDEAATVVIGLLDVLSEPITYIIFRDAFLYYSTEYPDLINVADSYLDAFQLNSYISDFDKQVLTAWLNDRLDSLK